MKKLSIALFALFMGLNLSFGQTQFFAGGAARGNWGYQIGIPVDIQLNPQFAFTTGLLYVANKESDTYNPTVTRSSIVFRLPKTCGARERFYLDTYYFFGVSDARELS